MGIAALKKVRVIFGPIINAVVNAVTAASRYTFNGTDMHATIPDWTPLGLPWSRSLSCIPETVDGTVRHIDGGATHGIFISAANAVSATFIDVDGSTVRTITGPTAVVDVQLDIGLSATATDTILTVNGAPTASGFVAATVSQEAISTFAALATPAAFFHGPIWS